MKGFSIFLSEDLGAKEAYLKKMKAAGFQRIFTSLHIPEEKESTQLEQIRKLGALAQKYQLEIMADISKNALDQLGETPNCVLHLKNLGISGLRVDYGFTTEEIAQLSNEIKVGLNASTITEEELEELHHFGANFSKIEAWHNYYPRPETGLASDYFKKINFWLKKSGLKVVAFVPGDKKLRGPIYAGLPTLEKHRNLPPFLAALDLEQNCGVEEVFIGDPEISEESLKKFEAYEIRRKILLKAKSQLDISPYPFLKTTFKNRPDEAEAVIRFSETRSQIAGLVKKENCQIRSLGSITMDNEAYGRYMGEVQITKIDLPLDEKVNVLGYIAQEDLGLLAYCTGQQTIQLQWEKGEENGLNKTHYGN